MPVTAPADRHFKRAQVKPVKRRRFGAGRAWRIVSRTATSLAVAYGIYRGGMLIANARMLTINHIVVRGNERLSTGEVLHVLGPLRGQNILLVDLDAWQRRLMVSPWVGGAALRRVLPSTIEVQIRERSPMGIGRFGSQLYLVDQRGVIIDDYGPNYAEFDLPIIDGLASADRDVDGGADEARADLAARLLDAMSRRKDFMKRVSQIDVRDPHDAVVIMDGDSAVLHVGEDDFVTRLQAYVDVAPALRLRVPDIDYVDLRFDDRVYVRPAVGARTGAALQRRVEQ